MGTRGLGGVGFLLGDGKLNYGRESIIESYCSARGWHGVNASVDVQRVWNHGYNRDRGAVFVGSFRRNLEIVVLKAGGQ